MRSIVLNAGSLMFICLFLFYPEAFCQSDSLAVVQAKWAVKKIRPGIVHKHYWFNQTLFNASENLDIVEIKLNRKNRAMIAGDSRKLKPVSVFAKENEAIVAINGTFFDIKNGGSVDYVRAQGEEMNTTRLVNQQRTFHQRSAIVIHHNKISIQQWKGSNNWENELEGEHVMVTGPVLLQNEQRNMLDTIAFNTARHPRSAIALKGRRLWLVTVDGRNERSAGMSLFELASVLKWLKADDAINLDGGGSTTLWIKDYPYNGVVNYPSDNKALAKKQGVAPGTDLDNLPADEKKWDHSGERPVANVIVISRKP